MPQEKIPFVDLQSGYEELAGGSPLAMNVVVDGLGAVMRRPGLTTYSGAPSSVIDANGLAGIYATLGGALYAVGTSGAERPIYKMTGGGASTLGGGLPPCGLTGGSRPVFAETELLLVLAGGGAMQKIELATAISSRLNGSPPTASHVIAQSSRLLANDTVLSPGTAHFSDVFSGNADYSGAEVWTVGVGTAGFFSAEAKPDAITAITENTNEVFTWGPASTQVFQPDATFTYVPVAAHEVGTSAPYSIVKSDQDFYFLDQYHRFVMSNGRTFTPISDPIQRQLDRITTVSDCFGYRVVADILDCIVWTFPTDGRTFVYQSVANSTPFAAPIRYWGQWSGWNDATNNWASMLVNCATQAPGSPSLVVGTTDGKVGQFSIDAPTDLGRRIVSRVETGYKNHNTDSLKHCKAVYLSLKRGTATTEIKGWLEWRDRPGPWTRVPVSFGPSGETEIVVHFRSLGTYRRREWAFEFSDTSNFTLVSATEEFDVLGM